MIGNKKRPPPSTLLGTDGRREDHKTENICAVLIRQTVRVCRMIADGNGEDAVPLNKWFDCQWDAFLTLPPAMRAAFFSRGNYSCRTIGGAERTFNTWSWADETGKWITLSAGPCHTDLRVADVVSATVIYS